MSIIPLIPDWIVLVPVAFYAGKFRGKRGQKRVGK